MIDEEVEVVAAALARACGTSWSQEQAHAAPARVVLDRYRDRARVAIAALERFRASRDSGCKQDNKPDGKSAWRVVPHSPAGDLIQPGATVVYRPPGDQRAYPCRVVTIEGSRAYLEPVLRACTGWVSIERLLPSDPELGSANVRENSRASKAP
jgi:hypothetical protein